MKVLFVDQFGKNTGRDTLAQAQYIQDREGIEVTAYLSDNTQLPANKTYSVGIKFGFCGAYEGNILNKTKNYLKALKELKDYIKAEKFDIVHLQWFSLPWIEWIYVNSLRKYAKIVVTVHDVIPFNNRPMEMQCLDKLYGYADCLLFHTNSSLKEFDKLYKNKTPRAVITQGFCLKSDYQRIDNTAAKKHFNIPEDRVVYLFYGAIRESKGLDLLIQAIGSAQKKNEKIHLLAAGAFQKVDAEHYQKLVADHLSPAQATLNFTFVPFEEEQWYFSAADVLCLPYREITQSGVAQLGLMYELPMISSDIGEMGEVIRAEYNGELVPVEDIPALEVAIEKLAENQATRQLYAENSKWLAENEFSVEIKGNKVAEAYRKLV